MSKFDLCTVRPESTSHGDTTNWIRERVKEIYFIIRNTFQTLK